MIAIDWQQIIAWLLLGGSGIGGLIWGGKVAWTKFRSAKPDEETPRSADEPAPPGAVKWVLDIDKGMGSASAEAKLAALKVGASRDHAMALRISELEAKP